jgi:hypothetical protein
MSTMVVVQLAPSPRIIRQCSMNGRMDPVGRQLLHQQSHRRRMVQQSDFVQIIDDCRNRPIVNISMNSIGFVNVERTMIDVIHSNVNFDGHYRAVTNRKYRLIDNLALARSDTARASFIQCL